MMLNNANIRTQRGAARRPFRRGNAVLDAALVLPVLLSLTFGMVEFGYYFYVKNTLEGAAREGCRAGIVSGATQSSVTTAISNYMTAAGISSAMYTTTTTPSDITTATIGSSITVQITATWGTIGQGFRPLGLIGTSKQVIGITQMRKEG